MTAPGAAALVLAAAVLCLPMAAGVRLRGLHPAPARTLRFRVPSAPVVLGAVAGWFAAGPGGGLAGALVAALVRRRRAASRARGAAAALSGELADALRRVGEELRAGVHPAAALTGVEADGARARALLGPAAVAARLGDDVPAALRAAAGQRPEVAGDLERVAAAWALADRHGIPLAELLAGAQEDLRWRSRFAARVHAQLAGPRATAVVLHGLPVLGLVFGQLTGADPIGVLRDGLPGQLLLVIGVGLTAAGSAWSERILHRAVPR